MRLNHLTIAVIAGLSIFATSAVADADKGGKARPGRPIPGKGCLKKYRTGHDKLPLAAPAYAITVFDGKRFVRTPTPVRRNNRVVRWIGRGRDPLKVLFQDSVQPGSEFTLHAQIKSPKLKMDRALSCEMIKGISEKGLNWRQVAYEGGGAERTPLTIKPNVNSTSVQVAFVEKDIDVVNQMLPNTRFKMNGKTRGADGQRTIQETRGIVQGEPNFVSQDKNHNNGNIETFNNSGLNVASATSKINVENILVTRPVRDRATMGSGKRARKFSQGMEKHIAKMTAQIDAWQEAVDKNGTVKMRLPKNTQYNTCNKGTPATAQLKKAKWETFNLSDGQDANYAKYNKSANHVKQWLNQRIQTVTEARNNLNNQFTYVEAGKTMKTNVATLKQHGQKTYAAGKVLRSLVFTAAADINATMAFRNARLAGENKPMANGSGRTDASGYSMIEIGGTRGDTITGNMTFTHINNARNAKRGSTTGFSFVIPDHTKVSATHTIGGIPAYRLKADQVTMTGPTEVGTPAE
ncbi:MAG: hypothetical protein JRH20_04715 [Deltaproteobacteria bacterium]|nr:hypothetical protein [Deltaproteobacteria bacterium]